jgi:L-alanine-DL-glutamate epimerase-like enolase superfamily enzyme
MRRYREGSSDAGPLSPRPFCPGCIISTRGYDFREGQVVDSGFTVKDGAVRVPQGPGSGIVIDEAGLERHTLKKVVVYR